MKKSHVRFGLFSKSGYFALILIIVLCVAQPAFAGKLNDFEEDATGEKDEKDDGWLYFEDDEEDADDSILGAILGGIFKGIFSGIFSSVGDDDADNKSLRPSTKRAPPARESFGFSSQESAFPVFRFDAAYQNVESDIGAFDTRVELGFNAFAAQGRFTWYREGEPSDDLGMYHIHGLLRLPVGNHLKIGLGAGTSILDGNDQNYGFSMTAPVLIYPNEVIGLEFRPTWSWINENPLHDYDLGLALNYEFAAVRLGYRWMRSEHESLDGPYAGFALKF